MAKYPSLDEQIAFFAKNDYFLFENVLTRSEIDMINTAIDRNRTAEPGMWGGGPRITSSNCSLYLTECDFLLRHPAIYPLAKAIVPDIVFSEFGIMIRTGGQKATFPSWHQDVGVNEKNPYGVTALSAIFYLTDVDRTTARYTLIPGSHARAERPEPVEPGSCDTKGEFEVLGPAGTCVLVNAGIWHAGKIGDGERERRTLHLYFQPSSVPQFSVHTIFPRRWWDVPDPEQRRFFSHFNPMTRAVASDYVRAGA